MLSNPKAVWFEPVVVVLIPATAQSLMTTFLSMSWLVAVVLTRMPFWLKPMMMVSSTCTAWAAVTLMPLTPTLAPQGAVRLHGLASSPTPDTQVRVACAWAMDAKANVNIAIASALIVNRNLFIWSLLLL